MSATACAVCGGDDLFAIGLCSACADDGTPRTLIFLSPVDAVGRGPLSSRLRAWTGMRTQTSPLEEVMRGRQPLARLPEPITRAAVGALADLGIAARAVRERLWYRALPVSFLFMVLCVVSVGIVAAVMGHPMLVSASLVGALFLFWAASLQLRRPLLGAPRSAALLPPGARGALAASLAKLPPGQVRTLVLDVARAGEATYASLPEPFRTSALGESVVALVSEAGPLGLETARLQVIEQTRAGREGADGSHLRAACEERVRLLEQTTDVLSRIARQGADSDDAAAAEASALLGQVRAEATRRVDAEEEVSALLEGRARRK